MRPMLRHIMTHMAFLCMLPASMAYNLVQEYNSLTFFDTWDFFGGPDDLTHGNVNWVDQGTAFNDQLAFVNANYNVVIRVDNGYVPVGANRNSVRIKAREPFYVGTVLIADMVHLPYGCSVWPALWSAGPTWPNGGEIDIIEQINLATHNQMALHSLPGCFQSVPAFQTGIAGGQMNTGEDCSTAAGCVVEDLSPVSFGANFAATGGGVWAMQMDVAGLFIWFWSRLDIPPALTAAVAGTGPIDLKTWGPPSAAYMATGCNVTEFFSPQQLVLDITLCGDWAGEPHNYNLTCGAGLCYEDNVPGNGANYDEAYFEIKYIRTYTTGGPVPLPTPAQEGAVWNTATASAASTTVTSYGSLHASSPTSTAVKSSAVRSLQTAGFVTWLVLGSGVVGTLVCLV